MLMAEGAIKVGWAQTSSVMALIANCHRDPKADPMTADDFNPTIARKPKAPPPKVGIGALKSLLRGKRK